MTVKSDLETAKTQMASTLASITASPKPTYTVDGRSFSWTEYQKFLIESIKNLTALIEAEDEDFIQAETQAFT